MNQRTRYLIILAAVVTVGFFGFIAWDMGQERRRLEAEAISDEVMSEIFGPKARERREEERAKAMRLMTCRACEAEVSRNAASCPKCGEPF
jgi:hypothetical protein